MRIFFCERCRKRLTDDDVAKGLAVDKKFNGVFCKGCAAGVEVLESWSLPEHQKQVQRKTTPHGGQAVAVAAPVHVAQATHTHPVHVHAPATTAHRKATVYSRSSAHHRESSRDSGGYIKAPAHGKKVGQPLSVKLCIALACGVLLIGVGLFFAFNGKGAGAEKRKPVQTSSAETPSEPAPTPAKKADPSQAEKNAEQAFERLNKDWATLSSTAQKKRAEDFLSEHGNSIVASRVRVMLSDIKK